MHNHQRWLFCYNINKSFTSRSCRLYYFDSIRQLLHKILNIIYRGWVNWKSLIFRRLMKRIFNFNSHLLLSTQSFEKQPLSNTIRHVKLVQTDVPTRRHQRLCLFWKTAAARWDNETCPNCESKIQTHEQAKNFWSSIGILKNIQHFQKVCFLSGHSLQIAVCKYGRKIYNRPYQNNVAVKRSKIECRPIPLCKQEQCIQAIQSEIGYHENLSTKFFPPHSLLPAMLRKILLFHVEGKMK